MTTYPPHPLFSVDFSRFSSILCQIVDWLVGGWYAHQKQGTGLGVGSRRFDVPARPAAIWRERNGQI
jgi:hypothetical protein